VIGKGTNTEEGAQADVLWETEVESREVDGADGGEGSLEIPGTETAERNGSDGGHLLPAIQERPTPARPFVFFHLDKCGGSSTRYLVVQAALRQGYSFHVPCFTKKTG
ncbi:unnamed protein product, partial [Discosporangium mesarthrocarpum]